jgi:biofilm protein TabA
MKKTIIAGFALTLSAVIIFNGNLIAQNSQNKSADMKKAKEWFDSREWADGLKLKAHSSINIQEFSDQFHGNKKYWAEAFNFLKNTNLDTLAPGKYNLDGTNVYAIVSDGPTKAIGDTKWENHKNYIDIQYVIRGKEKMGIAPLEKAVITEAYDATKDIAFNSVSESDCHYYVAEPGIFLMFFPVDAHRPSIKVEGSDTVKKVVIKIRVAGK